ncbi:hypothetical protein EDC01DRAFT_683299 [Geopyxis carbonaria]|nr:hypothetical protein EDC01DRAFT_683299 [Geopyxis carbonaria]
MPHFPMSVYKGAYEKLANAPPITTKFNNFCTYLEVDNHKCYLLVFVLGTCCVVLYILRNHRVNFNVELEVGPQETPRRTPTNCGYRTPPKGANVPGEWSHESASPIKNLASPVKSPACPVTPQGSSTGLDSTVNNMPEIAATPAVANGSAQTEPATPHRSTTAFLAEARESVRPSFLGVGGTPWFEKKKVQQRKPRGLKLKDHRITE